MKPILLRLSRLAPAAAVLLAVAAEAPAQTRPIVGIRERPPTVHALVGATVVTEPGQSLDGATIVVRNGIITDVGTSVKVPSDAQVDELDGFTIYAGFIEPWSSLPLAEPSAQQGAEYWNQEVRPELDAAALYRPDTDETKKAVAELRKLGFTAAVIAPGAGVVRGQSTLVGLGDGVAGEVAVQDRVGLHLGFPSRGRGRSRGYPSSLMGAIALIRQSFLDAQWYDAAQKAYAAQPDQKRPETNLALAALAPFAAGQGRLLFETGNALNLLRAQRIAREFNLTMIYKGSGDEYQQIDRIVAGGARPTIIVPLNFPEAPKVADPLDALDVSLATLQHWELAPENPARLHAAGVDVAFTSDGLSKKKDLFKNLRTAISRGLSRDTALAGLTTVPAKLLGVDDRLGTIARGKIANFVVSDGSLFDDKTKFVETWIDGRRYEVAPRKGPEPEGRWSIACRAPSGKTLAFDVELARKGPKLEGSIPGGESGTKLKSVTVDGARVSFVVPAKAVGLDKGVVRLSGSIRGRSVRGLGALPDGTPFEFQGGRAEAVAKKPHGDESGGDKSGATEATAKTVREITRPLGAFGRHGLPEQVRHILIKNATIWTSGPAGRLPATDMLVGRGLVTRIGKNLTAPEGALVIDATGKHVTPGLIDCHSHTAISGGVNEGTQACTAEVRIGDVVNCDDINLYRQLAGGLTAANLLHGSANPIGGQNQVIKLRWGGSPEQLKLKGAKPGIKFALGENVKQSRNPDGTRYPRTRMGVEQFFYDRFRAARDYERKHIAYASLAADKRGVIPPRRDLELEALVEILHGQRIVHCHSYRQDEILGLLRMAEHFGFRVGTLQHILEGYKVADVIARHGAGASSFSDWWAYKFEVYDAIPYNGALMHDAGVVVSFNSDSSELARRLNTEAAKAVKYGGVSEEEALKFVTLNPARQLRVDKRIGSLEVGKDGDFVIWSGDPLSTYSICEQTWIEGRRYFDRGEDQKMRAHARAERARIIQEIFAKGLGKTGRKRGATSEEPRYSCCDHGGAR